MNISLIYLTDSEKTSNIIIDIKFEYYQNIILQKSHYFINIKFFKFLEEIINSLYNNVQDLVKKYVTAFNDIYNYNDTFVESYESQLFLDKCSDNIAAILFELMLKKFEKIKLKCIKYEHYYNYIKKYKKNITTKQLKKEKNIDTCSICLESLLENRVWNETCCHHFYHPKCLKKLCCKVGPPICPLCRTNIKNI